MISRQIPVMYVTSALIVQSHNDRGVGALIVKEIYWMAGRDRFQVSSPDGHAASPWVTDFVTDCQAIYIYIYIWPVDALATVNISLQMWCTSVHYTNLNHYHYRVFLLNISANWNDFFPFVKNGIFRQLAWVIPCKVVSGPLEITWGFKRLVFIIDCNLLDSCLNYMKYYQAGQTSKANWNVWHGMTLPQTVVNE